jgi:hypothetical protein
MSGVTLVHSESDVEPACSVVLAGGRLCDDDLVDLRRIELTFKFAYYARLGWHDDNEDIRAVGYSVEGGEETFEGAPADYVRWSARRWREQGHCPESGFYVATRSDWLGSVQRHFSHIPLRHYVIDGRDGYVEVLASGFSWREWIWNDGSRDLLVDPADAVGTGAGVE